MFGQSCCISMIVVTALEFAFGNDVELSHLAMFFEAF
jgi:hypothetical protein